MEFLKTRKTFHPTDINGLNLWLIQVNHQLFSLIIHSPLWRHLRLVDGKTKVETIIMPFNQLQQTNQLSLQLGYNSMEVMTASLLLMT